MNAPADRGECFDRVLNQCEEEGLRTMAPEQMEETLRSALRESAARNRAILKALPDLMFLTSKDGVFLDFHAKEPNVLLLPPEQLLGKNVWEVLPQDLAEALARCFVEAVETGETIIHEYSLPLP